jgi:hypothetical protein
VSSLGGRGLRGGARVWRRDVLNWAWGAGRTGKRLLPASLGHRTGVDGRGDNGSPMYRQRARNAYFYYCNHGCPAGSRLMVKMSYLDSVVDDMVMSAGDEPHMITVVTPGDDHGDEIDQIRQEIRDLDPEANDYDSRLAELRDELKNLRTLPSTPGRSNVSRQVRRSVNCGSR